MKKRLVAVWMAAMLLTLSGCTALLAGVSERESSGEGGSTQAVSPEGGAGEASARTVTLYFGFRNEALLMPVDVDLETRSSQSLEWAIVEALIDGPSADRYDLVRLIDPSTQIIDISEQNGYLSITLSAEFLQVPQDVVEYWSKSTGDDRDEDAIRQLAVYSIVDSITGTGLHSRVLLFVDQDGDGVGERLKRYQVGLGDSAYEPIDPLERDTSLVLTPENTVGILLTALIEKDWNTVDLYLSLYDASGDERPEWDELSKVFSGMSTLVSFEVRSGTVIAEDGQSATLCTRITYISGGSSTETVIPIRLVREEDMWRVSYASLTAVLPSE